MANTYNITDFAMYLVRTDRAKDVTSAGKRVRSALRANKPAMAKVDKNVRTHQKGATYSNINESAAKILADALNIKNVKDVKRKPTTRKRKATVKTPDTSNNAS